MEALDGTPSGSWSNGMEIDKEMKVIHNLKVEIRKSLSVQHKETKRLAFRP